MDSKSSTAGPRWTPIHMSSTSRARASSRPLCELCVWLSIRTLLSTTRHLTRQPSAEDTEQQRDRVFGPMRPGGGPQPPRGAGGERVEALAARVIASDRRTSVNRGTLELFQLYIVLWQTWQLA
jgi:hypothetical protein